MQEFVLPVYINHKVYAALYTSVTNAAEIRDKLLAGDEEYEYAFIDATTVVGVKQILAAAFRAIHDAEDRKLKTRNVHSETVFSLSANNNIGDALRRFGITPTTTSLLCVKILPSSAPPPAEHLASLVKGEEVEVRDEVLRKGVDMKVVRKNYKLGGADKWDDAQEVESVVLGLMALRGVA